MLMVSDPPNGSFLVSCACVNPVKMRNMMPLQIEEVRTTGLEASDLSGFKAQEWFPPLRTCINW